MLDSRNYQNETNSGMTNEVITAMKGCENCRIPSCPILFKSECPFNRLWEISEKQTPEVDLRELTLIAVDNKTNDSLMVFA